MIFNINTTSLNDNIPLVEGYDPSTGFATLLIENAQNDLAMFKTMLEIDAREIAMRRHSNGSINEAELSALHEAAAKGILEKIAEMLEAFASKIKSIFEKFVTKVMTIAASDNGLVKKFKKVVLEKEKNNVLSDVAIKWRKLESDWTPFVYKDNNVEDFIDIKNYDEDDNKIFENIAGFSKDKAKEEFDKLYFSGEVEDTTIGKAGIKMSTIIDWLENYSNNLKTFKSESDAFIKSIKELAKKLKKEAKEAKEESAEDANKKHRVATVTQQFITLKCKASMDAIKAIHKQYRAVFAKAINFNGKNKEQTDQVSEAAEQEVEDVINGAIDKTEVLDDFNISTYDVKDSDVSDDPNKLVYDKVDKYTTEEEPEKDGTVDVDLDSKIGGKSEAAYFGELLY